MRALVSTLLVLTLATPAVGQTPTPAPLPEAGAADPRRPTDTGERAAGARRAALRAVASIDGGRPQEAIRALHEALAEFPRDAHLHALLGMALLRSGDAEGAHAELRTAVTLAPRQAAYYIALGDVLLQRCQVRNARHAYLRASQLRPGDAVAAARVAADYGELEEHCRDGRTRTAAAPAFWWTFGIVTGLTTLAALSMCNNMSLSGNSGDASTGECLGLGLAIGGLGGLMYGGIAAAIGSAFDLEVEPEPPPDVQLYVAPDGQGATFGMLARF